MAYHNEDIAACMNDNCPKRLTCLRWQLGTNKDPYQTYLDGSMCDGEFYVKNAKKIKGGTAMKANEAPEKLYLFENPVSGTPDDRWLSKRSGDTDIEYTRTDAFIEKACSWLENNLQGIVGVVFT